MTIEDIKQAPPGSNNAAAITLSGDTAFAPPTQRIWVGGAGNVKVDTVGGQTGVVYTAVPAGSYLTIRATKVYSTSNGTTATNLVAEY